MNDNIKQIARETFQKVTQGQKIDMKNLESVIDTYVLEVIKETVFKASDVIRENARKEKNPEVAAALKVATIDMLDHFGL